MDLNLTDIIVLAIIVICAVFGAIKGFVSQIAGMFALIAGIWCACKLSELFAEYVKKWFELGEKALYIISFIVILVLIIIVVHFIGRGIEKIVRLTMLNWLNRILGFLFAAVKVVLVFSVAAYILNYIEGEWGLLPNGFGQDSLCYHSFLKISRALFPYLQSIAS